MTRLYVLALSALALACALAPAASARSGITPKIVNGSDATIEDFPFQALLFEAGTDPAGGGGSDSGGRLCGGVIADSTHIFTAAHCVFDVFRPGQVSHPGDQQVFVGSADLTDTGATIENVTDIAFDPQYDPNTNVHDVALVTIDPPLTLGSQNGTDKIAPISIAGSQPADGTDLTVSGWGDMTAEPPDGSGTPSFSNTLQKATVPLVNDTTCVNDYAAQSVPIDPTLLFCAGDNNPAPIEDSCQGDSGGPIVTGVAGSYELVGLVDSGIGCAQPGFPGIYTRLTNTDLQTFLTSGPPDAPSQNSATTLSGTGAAGQTLTCATGDWSGGPDFTYQFFRLGSATPLTSASPTGNTYTIQPADVGSRIQCEVKASNNGGYGFGESNSVLVPVPPGPPGPPSPPPVIKDTTAPKLKLNHKACTKTSCTLKLTVTDPGTPSSGVAKVKATLSYSTKVSCRKHGRRTTCTKHVRRNLKATAGSGGKFTIVIKHLSPGKGYQVSLLPFDNAGNRPQFSTITNLRTKSRHPSGLF